MIRRSLLGIAAVLALLLVPFEVEATQSFDSPVSIEAVDFDVGALAPENTFNAPIEITTVDTGLGAHPVDAVEVASDQMRWCHAYTGTVRFRLGERLIKYSASLRST